MDIRFETVGVPPLQAEKIEMGWRYGWLSTHPRIYTDEQGTVHCYGLAVHTKSNRAIRTVEAALTHSVSYAHETGAKDALEQVAALLGTEYELLRDLLKKRENGGVLGGEKPQRTEAPTARLVLGECRENWRPKKPEGKVGIESFDRCAIILAARAAIRKATETGPESPAQTKLGE